MPTLQGMRRTLSTVLCATTALALGGAAPTAALAATCAVTVPAIAHRGGTEQASENTLRAYASAARAGVTWWETDVRLTADGVPVLLHDETLDRTTTGVGPVSAMTADDLRATVRTDDGQVVPTLRELMALAYAHQARILLETKADPDDSGWTAIQADVDAYGMRPQVILMSFSAAVVAEAQQAAPDVRTALVADTGYVPVAELTALGINAYVKHHYSITAARVAEWSGPLDVYAWTVDAQTDWERMHWYQTLDGVITNRPIAYLQWQRARTC